MFTNKLQKILLSMKKDKNYFSNKKLNNDPSGLKYEKRKGYISRDMKITSKMIASFLLIAVIPIIFIASFSYISAKNTMRTKILTYSNQLGTQITSNINSQMNAFEDIQKHIYIGTVAIDDAFKKESDDKKNMDNSNKIQDFVSSLISYSDSVAEYGILTTDASYGTLNASTLGSEFYSSDIYKKISEDSQDFWVTGLNGNYSEIYIMRAVTSEMLNLSGLKGIVAIGFSVDKLSEVLSKIQLGKGSGVVLIDDNGIDLINTVSGKTGEKVSNEMLSFKNDGSIVAGNGDLRTYGTCDNGWRIVMSTPTKLLYSELNKTGTTNAIIALICALLAIIVGILVSMDISKPIYAIVALMKKAETGDLSVESKFEGKNEIGTLAKSFNIMINNIKELITSTEGVVQEVEKEAKGITEISRISAKTSEHVASP